MIEYELRWWFIECIDEDVRVSDDMIRAKAMEVAKNHHLLQGTRPFACSPKWLRRIKSRYGIVDGQFTDFTQSLSRKRDRALGYWTPNSRNSLPEIVDNSPQSDELERTESANAVNSSDPGSSGSSSRAAAVESREDALSSVMIASSSHHITNHTTHTSPIDVQNCSPPPTLEYTAANPSHEVPSLQSSSKPGMLNWLETPDLAATTSQGVNYDGMSDDLALDLQVGSAAAWDVNMPFLLTDRPTSCLPSLPDMQTSGLPMDRSTAPAICAPLDSTIGMSPMDDVSSDVVPFYSPTIDPSQQSSFIWSSNASLMFAPSVGISASSMSSMDQSSISVTQSCVSQEDIDRLAAEMMHWPVEDLLGDMGMPASQAEASAAYYSAMSESLSTPLPPQWPCDPSSSRLGNIDFLFTSP